MSNCRQYDYDCVKKFALYYGLLNSHFISILSEPQAFLESYFIWIGISRFAIFIDPSHCSFVAVSYFFIITSAGDCERERDSAVNGNFQLFAVYDICVIWFFFCILQHLFYRARWRIIRNFFKLPIFTIAMIGADCEEFFFSL